MASEYLAKMTTIKKLHTENVTDNHFKSCKDNPIINLLPNYVSTQLKDKLNKNLIPIDQLNNCNIIHSENKSTYSCCNNESINSYIEYLSQVVIPNKLKIYDLNTNMYSLIYQEHKRNFKTFTISDTDFDYIFLQYKNIIEELKRLNKELLKKSIIYNWNTFCNYVCQSFELTKNLCKIKNETILVNEKYYYLYKYECNYNREERYSVRESINNFYMKLKNLNNTIADAYNSIRNKAVIKTNNTFNNITTVNNSNIKNLNFEMIMYLKNSINDGEYVSKSISTSPICDNKIYKDINCESILNKICIPFYCYDDIYTQYYDNSTIYLSESIENSNFSIISDVYLYNDTKSYDKYKYLFNDNSENSMLKSLLHQIEAHILCFNISIKFCIILFIFLCLIT